MSSRWRGGKFEENGWNISVAAGIRARDFDLVSVMAIGTSEGHVDMPGGYVRMTLTAKSIRSGDRFMLTRLLITPRNLSQHDAVL